MEIVLSIRQNSKSCHQTTHVFTPTCIICLGTNLVYLCNHPNILRSSSIKDLVHFGLKGHLIKKREVVHLVKQTNKSKTIAIQTWFITRVVQFCQLLFTKLEDYHIPVAGSFGGNMRHPTWEKNHPWNNRLEVSVASLHLETRLYPTNSLHIELMLYFWHLSQTQIPQFAAPHDNDGFQWTPAYWTAPFPKYAYQLGQVCQLHLLQTL